MPDPKRVIHLISSAGNWEPFTRVANLAAALRAGGYASVVAAPDHSRLWEMAEGAGVEVAQYALERSLNPMRWKALADMIGRTGAGIVHAHDAEAAALVARAGVFLRGVRVVVSRYDLAGGIAGAEHGGRVRAVVCASRAMAERYAAAGAAPGKLHVVFAGANLTLAERAEEERAALRAALREAYCPGNEKPLFLVSIAPFDGRGGQGDLVEAMPEILAALPQARLFLMGEGPEREELRRRIKLLAVEGEVVLLDPDRAYHRLLAAADLYIAWEREAYAGLMLQDAMAAGRGVAARAGGCHGELIEDGESGVLAGGESVDALRDAVLELLSNRSRREKLGKRARERAAVLCNAAECAARVAGVYAL